MHLDLEVHMHYVSNHNTQRPRLYNGFGDLMVAVRYCENWDGRINSIERKLHKYERNFIFVQCFHNVLARTFWNATTEIHFLSDFGLALLVLHF